MLFLFSSKLKILDNCFDEYHKYASPFLLKLLYICLASLKLFVYKNSQLVKCRRDESFY